MIILCEHKLPLDSECLQCVRENEQRRKRRSSALSWAEGYLTALDDVKFGKVTANPFQE